VPAPEISAVADVVAAAAAVVVEPGLASVSLRPVC
jgi:hypothetical protein